MINYYEHAPLLNLQEAVLDLQSNVEDIKSIQGNLGIIIIGEIDDLDDLPAEYSEEFAAFNYGDAYVYIIDADVGEYTFYVKTRANSEKPVDHWFELNIQGIQGPVGPRGPQGNTGPKGSIWYTGTKPSVDDVEISDMYLSSTGGVEQCVLVNGSKSWLSVGSIKGATGNTGGPGPQGPQGLQGIQGPIGPKGDPGGFIHIVGQVENVSQLPVPPTDNTAAYFVGTDEPISDNPIYLWAGDQGWISIGLLNLATYVTVGGQFQGLWDADTKLDKKTTNKTAVYSHVDDLQTEIEVSNSVTPNTIPVRTNGGQVKVFDPVLDVDAVNLGTLKDKMGGRYITYAVVVVGSFSDPVVTDSTAFVNNVTSVPGEYEFTYYSGYWEDASNSYTDAQLGISVTGTPQDGDSIKIELNIEAGSKVPEIISAQHKILGVNNGLVAWENAPEGGIFVATYGTTTVAQIRAAVAAGKMVICIYSGDLYTYTRDEGSFIFLYSFPVQTTGGQDFKRLSVSGTASWQAGHTYVAGRGSVTFADNSVYSWYKSGIPQANRITFVLEE